MIRRNTMERVVCIVNGSQLRDVAIRPGTTTADIVRELGVPDSYWISARDGVPFDKDEVIYDRIRDGDKLFMSAPADVAD